jgi:hypothetical protein
METYRNAINIDSDKCKKNLDSDKSRIPTAWPINLCIKF